MVVLQVYTKSIKTKYKAYLFSKASLIFILSGIASIILPFILAYKSKGFWLMRDVLYEHPDVRFRGEYLLQAITNNISHPLTCSTYPYYRKVLKPFLACPSIQVREIDNNFDMKIDELFIRIKVNLPANCELQFFSLIIPIDYKLHSPTCPLQMQSAVIFQLFVPLNITGVNIIGDLHLHQSDPVYCSNLYVNNLYNHSLIRYETNINSYRTDNIIADYAKRNLTTILTNIYTTFDTDNKNYFELRLKIKYSEHKFYYKPGFWQIMKWAWVQYVAYYVIVAFIVTKIKSYIFHNHLVLFYEDNPLKRKHI